MGKETKDKLKGRFQQGDTPGAGDFGSLIDSQFNLEETGTQIASGSLKLYGNITATEYIISSSVTNRNVLNVSGSTHFGDDTADIHARTGSMSISGSFQLQDGNETADYVLTSNATGVGTWQAATGGGGGVSPWTGSSTYPRTKTTATVQITGSLETSTNITAGGNITTTGGNILVSGEETNVTAPLFVMSDFAAGNYFHSIVAIGGSATGDLSVSPNFKCIGDPTRTLVITGSMVMSGSGHITSSGNISSSGDISIVSASLQHIASPTNVVINSAQWTVDQHGKITGGDIVTTGGMTIGGVRETSWPSSVAFPFIGGAQISGSLIVSSSFTAGDTNSNVLKLIGSGSVSGSGLFEIQGSSTTLFSVTDDMTGELFAANDASGLSIVSAFADRTVKLGKPGGFGIVISGSNPMPTDAAARIDIQGSTYFSGSISDFSGVSEIKALQRPITTLTAHVTASSTNVGYYFVAGGNLTCSIQANSTVTTPTGAEYEFFQTSSAGNFLFETGSGVTFYSKDGNLTLAGQYSAASLKKIATDTWTLVGDLT